jgi:hypothetical protein
MARLTVIRCPACSAPLQVETGQTHVTCGYCRATSQVAALVEPPPPAPPAPAPAPVIPAAPAPAAPIQPKSSGRAGLAIALVVAALGLSTAGYVFLGPGVGSTTLLLSEWYGVACLVDANGDEVLDFVGRVGRPGATSHRLAVVDGRDGSLVWSSAPDYDYLSHVLCLSDHTFGVVRPGFRLELHAATGGEPTTLSFADEPMSYGGSDECAKIGLKDRTEVGLRLPSGDEGACGVELTHHVVGSRAGRDWNTEQRLERDGVTYVVEPKQQGTPMLTVRAEQGERTLWTTPLSYALIGRDRAMLELTPDMVVTYGAAPTDSKDGVLIGLDRSSGAVRFAVAQRNRWSNNSVSELMYNGRYVVMTWGLGLHAYDPRSGERAWKIGGRT